jgi:hypothetical protein
MKDFPAFLIASQLGDEHIQSMSVLAWRIFELLYAQSLRDFLKLKCSMVSTDNGVDGVREVDGDPSSVLVTVQRVLPGSHTVSMATTRIWSRCRNSRDTLACKDDASTVCVQVLMSEGKEFSRGGLQTDTACFTYLGDHSHQGDILISTGRPYHILEITQGMRVDLCFVFGIRLAELK